jgi:excinuclease ABC subunit B
VQPTYAQSASRPATGTRIKKPCLDDMGPGTDRAIPRRPDVDPRTKAGAFGENVRGPHKPTLDEMGPHASLAVKKSSAPLPKKPDLASAPKPTMTREIESETEQKRRKGRARKTGRPGN